VVGFDRSTEALTRRSGFLAEVSTGPIS